MRKALSGTPIVGRTVPELSGARLLGIFVVAQALSDVQTLPRSGGTYWRDHALHWLDSREGRGIAGALGMPWADSPRHLSASDLPPARQVKAFWGGV